MDFATAFNAFSKFFTDHKDMLAILAGAIGDAASAMLRSAARALTQ